MKVKKKNRCLRCGSFDVDKYKGVDYRVNVQKAMQGVNIYPTGEYQEMELPSAMEDNSVKFPYPICYDCEISFRNWFYDKYR